jgi:hypothetical protein
MFRFYRPVPRNAGSPLARARRGRLLENLALRQQLAVLKRRHPRPRLDLLDKLFWIAVLRFWSGWQQSLIVVTPETVVRWHRAGFRLYWKLISKVRRPVGRRQTSKEIQELIFRMVVDGSCSSCERHSHLDPFRGSSSLIVMSSMDWRSRSGSIPEGGSCPLWFPNSSTETQDAAVLGSAGLNAIIASIQQEDSGGQEPECP